jgi:hypothetical protein
MDSGQHVLAARAAAATFTAEIAEQIRFKSPRRGASAPKRSRITPIYQPRTPATALDYQRLELAAARRRLRASKRRHAVLSGGWGDAARREAVAG